MADAMVCPKCGVEAKGNADGRCPQCSHTEDQTLVGPESLNEATILGTEGVDGLAGPPPTMMLPGRNGTDSAQPGRIRKFGDYELLSEIARGGMGVVYKARQVRLNRIVALKMILAGQLANDSDVKRFQAEATAAAGLDHVGIVPIFEIGELEGQHYFSMGYIDGSSLAQRVATGPLPPREAAAMVKLIAEAIDYAHQKGIVHRDLKPANVLLEQSGQPRVTDFGLAKQMQGDSGLTGSGQILGTPSYMPPEQAEGKQDQVGPSADIYALGAILYCLLTSRPPFQAANPMDTLLQVLNQEPVPPRQLNPQVPLDLETIVLKCLEKSPARRYRTAGEVVGELERYLAGQPILARPVGFRERTWRWCRRNPAVAGLLATVAMTLLLGTFISSYFAVMANHRAGENLKLASRESEAKKLAERRKADSDRNAKLAEERRVVAEANRVRAEQNAKLAEERRVEAEKNADLARRHQYVAQMNLVQTAMESHRLGAAALQLDQYRAEPHRVSLRGFEWYYWLRQCHRDAMTCEGHTASVISVAFHPKGHLLASGGWDGTVRLWETNTGELVRELKGHVREVRGCAFSPDGKWLVTGGADSIVRIWDVARGVLLRKIEGFAIPGVPAFTSIGVLWVGFSPDGQRVAAASDVGSQVKLWDANTGVEVQALRGHQGAVVHFAFNADGSRIATVGMDRIIRIWDTANGMTLKIIPAQSHLISRVAFHPLGKLLASTGESGQIKVWDLATGQEIRTISAHAIGVTGLSFSPDGRQMTSSSKDSLVKLWDVDSGQEVKRLVGHSKSVMAVAFHPDGRTIASGGDDHTIKFWDIQAPDDPRPLVGHQGAINSLVLSPDGRQVVTGGNDRTARVWEASTGTLVRSINASKSRIASLAVSPNGQSVAIGGEDRTISVCDLATGEQRLSLVGHPFKVTAVAYTPDGSRIVSASIDKSIRIWDASSGKELHAVRNHAAMILCLAISPSGKLAASGSADGLIKTWNPANGELVHTLKSHVFPVNAVAFDPQGNFLASGGIDQAIRIWDMTTGQEVQTLRGTQGVINSLRYLPDGSRLVASFGSPYSQSDDFALKFFDTHIWQETLSLRGHSTAVLSFDFNQDGTRLVTGGAEGKALIWNASPKPSRSELFSINRSYFNRVQAPGAPLAQYQDVLERTALLVKDAPEVPTFQLTLGVAQYRAGDHAASIATLEKLIKQARTDSASIIPMTFAFLAMAYSGLGQPKPALEQLAQLRRAMQTDEWSNQPRLLDLEREAAWSILSRVHQWRTLKPTILKSLGQSKLSLESDGSILATGENPGNNVYTLECPIDLQSVRALRLDVLRDDRLPSGGPGRLENGTFILTGIACQIRGAASAEPVNIPLSFATSDYVQGGHDPLSTIDGRKNPGWAIWRENQPLANGSLIVEPSQPVTCEPGSTLIITLRHDSAWKDGNLGRFKLSIAGSDNVK